MDPRLSQLASSKEEAMLEPALVRKIVKALKKKYPEDVWYKIHIGPYQERGIPDIIGCHKGRFIAIEVKTPENKRGPTPYQERQLHLIMEAGGYATTVTSVKEALAKIV